MSPRHRLQLLLFLRTLHGSTFGMGDWASRLPQAGEALPGRTQSMAVPGPGVGLSNPGGSLPVGEDESRKPYKYDCLAKDSENMKPIIKIEMEACFEL
ncbi:hypothetical protein HGM15179_008474 [Zosterops borbonicus]|uniref:Uncharacterized protein n=1 Tax=Zosterops borbonicus TaxID=364589 RepID=A0A8K1GIF2_9PASS|nr:hypothetical protein HGM15179_008474 [Zosterops borbonicus]